MFDGEPDMECIIQYTPPVPRELLDPVQEILRTRRPFVPGVFFDDPYEVDSYLPRQMIWREEYCLLVDRNVVTRWVGLVRGQQASPAHRVAAAIMLFARCADLLVEPTLAFYEIMRVASPEEINAEIDAFYTAEEAEPTEWATIALGSANTLRIPPLELRRPRQSYDLSVPLYRWRRCYILALKIGELHLEGGKPEDLMMRLLNWMYNDYLLGGPAVQLASHYFAPGGMRKRLLKSIESPDREKALAGIQNAAWDLTLVSEWLHRVRPSIDNPREKRRWILCTLDEAVARMAADVLSFDEAEEELATLNRMFAKVWQEDTAARLANHLYEYQVDRSNPSRYLNRDPKAEAIDEFISAGESAIRAWRPPGKPGGNRGRATGSN